VTRRVGRVLATLVVATLLAGVSVVAAPDPAGAHGVGGVKPTNFETVITDMQPTVRGVVVRAVDLGERLEVVNRSSRDVIVFGYDDEPYLRVGPRGAFENVRSPATYVNRTSRGTTKVPERADPEARPEWRKISDEPLARWHDHRAHWTGRDDPHAVRADPDREHVVQRFRVDLEQGGTAIAVRGLVRWIPASSAWPWIATAFVLAAVVVALSRTRLARVAVGVALLAVVALEVLHVAGAWGGTTQGTGARLGASVYAIGAAVVALVALVWLMKRGLHAAAPLVLITGLFVALAGGLADISVLTRSQLPTTLSYDVARIIVAAALGLGVGLAIAGALRLRSDPRPRRRAQPPGAGSWPETQSWHSSSSVA